jgi:hypothetical protein
MVADRPLTEKEKGIIDLTHVLFLCYTNVYIRKGRGANV